MIIKKTQKKRRLMKMMKTKKKRLMKRMKMKMKRMKWEN